MNSNPRTEMWKLEFNAKAVPVILCGLPVKESTKHEADQKVAELATGLKHLIINHSWFGLPKLTIANHVALLLQTIPAKYNWPQPEAQQAIRNASLKLIEDLPAQLKVPFTALLL